jgi:outer membrane protein W
VPVRQYLLFGLLTLSFAALRAAPAYAEDTGFEAGLRLGYGIPLGSATDNGDLSDAVGGQVPLILDIGYRVIPNLFIGLYAQYGFAWVGDNFDDLCDLSGASCSAHDIRLGVEGHFHFRPREKLDPWIGLGIGYEWLSMSAEQNDVELSMTFHGFEFVNLQAGLDIRVAENFYLGAFLTLTIAEFSEASVDGDAPAFGAQFGANGDIDDKGVHEWLLLGVRGAYAP